MAKPEELAKAAGTTVFRRSASGLIRQFGAYDVLVYNVAWAMLLIDGTVFTIIQGPYAFPAGDLVVAILLLSLWATPQFIAYAMLASTMPRSGGDYVWQSRILHGSIGFPTMMVMAFSLWIWIAFNGYWVTVFSSSPMFAILGVYLNNPSLIQLGTWLSTPDGIFFGTVVVNTITFLMFLPGITPGLKSGRYGFWLVIVGMIALTYQLGSYGHDQFVAQYNAFMAKLDPTHTDYYNYVIDTAKAAGFQPIQPFSWFQTVGAMTTVWYVLAWPMWVFLNLGEVKGAESLKRITGLTIGSLWICGVFMALWVWQFRNMVGWEFMASAGYDYYNYAITFPVYPFYTNIASMMGSSPIPAVLIALGVMAIGLWECWVNYVGGSRIMLACSLDRALPEWFGRVGRRFRQLVNVGIVYLVMGTIVGWLYDYTTFWQYTVAVSMVASAFQWFTMLSAVAFPYRSHLRDVWRVSPAQRYKIGGLAIISLCGIIGLVLQSVMLYYELTWTELFMNTPASIAAFLGLFFALFAYWWIARGYWKSKGIEMDLAYREVPPQ